MDMRLTNVRVCFPVCNIRDRHVCKVTLDTCLENILTWGEKKHKVGLKI
uniref:Uncharacterized protein n=1 Tax=Anguilla anguilla TaxID=7936 RepID=A0A0E9RDU9_ANGAN